MAEHSVEPFKANQIRTAIAKVEATVPALIAASTLAGRNPQASFRPLYPYIIHCTHSEDSGMGQDTGALGHATLMLQNYEVAVSDLSDVVDGAVDMQGLAMATNGGAMWFFF